MPQQSGSMQGISSTSPQPVIAAPRSGGNKGLVMGLAAVGGVIVIGIIVFATRSMKSTDQPTEAPPPTAAAPPPVATIAPQVDTATPEPPPTEPTAVTAAVQPSPPPTAATGSRPTTTAKPTTPAPSGCDGCIAAAQSGNYVGAAAALKSCADPGKKAACTALVKPRIAGAARSEAFQGNCSKAKAIMSAGMSFGLAASQFGDVTKNCK